MLTWPVLPVQAGQLAEKVRELEAKLTMQQQQHEQLSTSIGQEQRKIRFFFGHDLDQLNSKDLEELEAFHRRGLNAVQPHLVSSCPLTHPFRCLDGCRIYDRTGALHIN